MNIGSFTHSLTHSHKHTKQRYSFHCDHILALLCQSSRATLVAINIFLYPMFIILCTHPTPRATTPRLPSYPFSQLGPIFRSLFGPPLRYYFAPAQSEEAANSFLHQDTDQDESYSEEKQLYRPWSRFETNDEGESNVERDPQLEATYQLD